MTKSTDLTPAQARKLIWECQDPNLTIADLLLDSNQKAAYDIYKQSKHRTQVVVYARQSGKSFLMYTIATEECLLRPNITVVIVGPRLNQTKKIARVTMREILLTCPKNLRPRFNGKDNCYEFSNGSVMELAGANAGELESTRGPKAHLIIVDEAGFIDELKYGLRSILYPKLNTTKGKIVIATTPPKSAGHEFYEIMKKSEYEGTLIKRNIYDCPRYTPADIEQFASDVGGYDSNDFKREYLCQMISDEEFAVVPEATEDLLTKITGTWKTPPYYDPYVSMDIGGTDHFAILFAYYDFMNGNVIVQDELVIPGKNITSDKLSILIEQKEQQLWGFKRPYLRVADNNNKILLNDMNIKHHMVFLPTAKDHKEAAVNNLRMLLADNRIIIDPKCKSLLFCLKSATWAKSRKTYDKSADGGHYDALDALVYMLRNIHFSKNPYPHNFGFSSNADIFGANSQRYSDIQQHFIDMRSPFKKDKS